MMRSVFVFVTAVLIFATTSPASAARVKIKMGTLAPKGSPWYDGVRKMGEDWKQASGGKVRLKIYEGGVAGDESDMIRKMNIGQLHAAMLTGVGLAKITRSALALQIPMVLDSYEALDYVRDRLAPKIEKELEAAGFVVLSWGDAGWVHFFSKAPAASPADFSKMKLFTWSGDADAASAWKAAGFDPVPMSATDVMSGLQTGLINSFATTPIYALSSQWFGLTKHMVAVRWAPLSGVTLVTKKRWRRIDPGLRKQLRESGVARGEEMKKSVRALGSKALDAMKQRGLKIHQPTDEELVQWRGVADRATPILRGKAIPLKYYDEVIRLAKEHKAQAKKVSVR